MLYKYPVLIGTGLVSCSYQQLTYKESIALGAGVYRNANAKPTQLQNQHKYETEAHAATMEAPASVQVTCTRSLLDLLDEPLMQSRNRPLRSNLKANETHHDLYCLNWSQVLTQPQNNPLSVK